MPERAADSLEPDKMSSSQKVVLITGASSGVGQTTARLLSQKSYKVFGTSRNPASAEAMTNKTGRIDVLVNNAAYELAGAVEEISMDEVKAQFETNFFGVVRMVKAVLPSMRQL